MRISARLYRRGEGWFRDIRYKDPETGIHVRERVFAGATKAEAQSSAAQRLHAIQEESQAPKGGIYARESFEDYAYKWLERKRMEVEHKTFLQQHSGIIRFAIPVLGNKPLCQIDKGDLFKVRDAILEKMGPESKGISRNHMMVGLKCLLADAFDRGHIATNPAAGLKKLKFKQQPTEVNPLSAPEIRTFLERVDPYYRDYFLLAFLRGPRHGELIPLRWRHVDFANKTIMIRTAFKLDTNSEGSPKTPGSTRDLPMDDTLYKMLLQRKSPDIDENSYLFPGKNGSRVNPKDLRTAWHEGLAKAGLQDRFMMQTRHTFASVSISAGEDIYWVMRIMGHTTTQMIHKYYGRFINNRTRRDGLALQNAMAGESQEIEGAATSPEAMNDGASPAPTESQNHEPIRIPLVGGSGNA